MKFSDPQHEKAITCLCPLARCAPTPHTGAVRMYLACKSISAGRLARDRSKGNGLRALFCDYFSLNGDVFSSAPRLVLGRVFGRGVSAKAAPNLVSLGIGLCLIAAIAGCGGWNGSVGAILGKDNRSGRVFVREVPPGLGAAQAGLEEGDEVIAIEGKPTAAMSADELRAALRGKVGTAVNVTIVRRGETRAVKVERSPFQEAP